MEIVLTHVSRCRAKCFVVGWFGSLLRNLQSDTIDASFQPLDPLLSFDIRSAAYDYFDQYREYDEL